MIRGNQVVGSGTQRRLVHKALEPLAEDQGEIVMLLTLH